MVNRQKAAFPCLRVGPSRKIAHMTPCPARPFRGVNQPWARVHSRRFLPPHPGPRPLGERASSSVGRRIERYRVVERGLSLFLLPQGDGEGAHVPPPRSKTELRPRPLQGRVPPRPML